MPLSREHRIAGGAIVFDEGNILLVRYRDGKGGTYLAGPGGGVREDESLEEAIEREVKEETGLTVEPLRIVLVEDMLSRKHRICKVWFACAVTGGRLEPTTGAAAEGIIAAGWFERSALEMETVYPRIIKEADWTHIAHEGWKPPHFRLREVDF